MAANQSASVLIEMIKNHYSITYCHSGNRFETLVILLVRK